MAGPKKRSDAVKAGEAARVALGQAAAALPLEERRAKIRTLVAGETRDFLTRRYGKIKKLKLKDLSLNILMLRTIRQIHGLDTPEDVIEYVVNATLVAGNETAYGWLVDLYLPPLFGAITPPEREDDHQWEAFKEIDKEATKPNPATGEVKRHLVSIKAGPMTINDTMAHQMHANVAGFVTHGNDPVIYAVSYGRREQLSNKPDIVKGDYPDDKVAILVGREFWDWLAGYEDAHVDIFNGMAEGEAMFAAEAGKPIDDLLKGKKTELASDFRSQYQIQPGDDMWKKLLETGF